MKGIFSWALYKDDAFNISRSVICELFDIICCLLNEFYKGLAFTCRWGRMSPLFDQQKKTNKHWIFSFLIYK